MSVRYSRAALAMDAAQMAEKNFSNNFAAFAPQAWARFDASSQDVTSWARAEAAIFKRTISPQIEFLRPYYALIQFAKVQQGLEEQRKNMAQQNKSMEATQYETVRVQKPASFYEQKLGRFAPVAWTRYNPSNTDIANWARNEARTFYHLCDGAYPFVTAWRFLCEYGEQRSQSRENSSVQEQRNEVAQQAARDFQDAALVTTVTEMAATGGQLRMQSSSATMFAADGEQTEAERRAGRAELNRVLFREYTAWWDAFEAEAVEDMDADAPTASQRFARHCSKILQRRTGLRMDLIEPVVEAWLLDKANA